MIIISPHLDDAVFSVGQVLAAHPGATVATVCAGLPPVGFVTTYDQSAGFESSRESVEQRRTEDYEACAVLDCDAEHGPILDGAHGQQDPNEVLAWLTAQMIDHETVLIPAGIHHPDHLMVSNQARLVANQLHTPNVWLYEELPYRVHHPKEAALRTRSGVLNDFSSGAIEAKQVAVECYRSQMSPAILRTVFVPERLWRLR